MFCMRLTALTPATGTPFKAIPASSGLLTRHRSHCIASKHSLLCKRCSPAIPAGKRTTTTAPPQGAAPGHEKQQQDSFVASMLKRFMNRSSRRHTQLYGDEHVRSTIARLQTDSVVEPVAFCSLSQQLVPYHAAQHTHHHPQQQQQQRRQQQQQEEGQWIQQQQQPAESRHHAEHYHSAALQQPHHALLPPGVSTISWPGHGVFFFWQLGVMHGFNQVYGQHVMQQYHFIGSSSGALLSVIAACQLQPHDILQAASHVCDRAGVYRRRLGLAGIWGNLVREFLELLLPHDAAEACSQRVTLLTTAFPQLYHIPIRQFDSRDDVIQAVMGSVHIPLLMDGKWSAPLLTQAAAALMAAAGPITQQQPAANEQEKNSSSIGSTNGTGSTVSVSSSSPGSRASVDGIQQFASSATMKASGISGSSGHWNESTVERQQQSCGELHAACGTPGAMVRADAGVLLAAALLAAESATAAAAAAAAAAASSSVGPLQLQAACGSALDEPLSSASRPSWQLDAAEFESGKAAVSCCGTADAAPSMAVAGSSNIPGGRLWRTSQCIDGNFWYTVKNCYRGYAPEDYSTALVLEPQQDEELAGRVRGLADLFTGLRLLTAQQAQELFDAGVRFAERSSRGQVAPLHIRRRKPQPEVAPAQ